ncbi:lysophospholipase [Actinomycetospora sp. NBRC 106375]|uniref:alpha/beta fold hydrolase n=1 Tax=Actinomycetospora sp. NBRC 106375 TaxID=3032207 RepID=UPI0024A194FF|nr:alpha/beta fold hydrolase [Actinomycetospora sp. NBRC 106375]GLZ44187.1 lysophospholipase [Actinomycetospora sp. NBRC 106375]
MPTFPGAAGRVVHDSWLPRGDARAVVVLLHGYGEHLGLYDALARRLTAHGIAVHDLDAVGHGRSDGERALIPSWDLLVDDARTLAGIARAQHPGVPLTVVGHSGGAVAATLLALRSPEIVDAVVLSGAPVRAQEWIQEWLALGEPELPMDDPREGLSTHPEYVDTLLHDPLTHHGGFRRETLAAVAVTWPEIADGLAAGRPDVPALLVHGEADPLVPVEHARLTAAQLPDACVVTFPGDQHDVLNEHDRDAVHDVVVAFVASVGAATVPRTSDSSKSPAPVAP